MNSSLISQKIHEDQHANKHSGFVLKEYEWPQDSGKYNFLQEHISRFLNLKAFHRKYEEIKRRFVSPEEKHYLLDIGLISEVEANFRLVALKYKDMMKLLKENFPRKYQFFRVMVQEREIMQLTEKLIKKQGHSKKFKEISLEYTKSLTDTIKFNINLNNERRVQRPFSIDLQSLQLHFPRKCPSPKIINLTDLDMYPIALIPGQYQTNFIKYTPDQMFSFFEVDKEKMIKNPTALPNIIANNKDNIIIPENTDVALVPTPKRRGRKRKADLTISNLKTKEKATEIQFEPNNEETIVALEEPKSEFCAECKMPNIILDQYFITCSHCNKKYHAACMDVGIRLLDKIKEYDWACYYCKKCLKCNSSENSDNLLLCDSCDRAYHSDCLGVEVPLGRWVCDNCGICSSCLKRKPSGSGWICERISQGGQTRLVQIHCARCSKKFNEGQYCPVCLEVHWSEKQNKSRIVCLGCNSYVHPECMTPKSTNCLVCSGVVDKRV